MLLPPLITDDAEIAAVILPLLQARQMARSKCAALDRRLIGSVQGDATCRGGTDPSLVKALEGLRGRIGDYREGTIGLVEWDIAEDACVYCSPLKWRRRRLLVDVQVAPVFTAGM